MFLANTHQFPKSWYISCSSVCEGKPICNYTFQPKQGYYKCWCDENCTLYGDCCSDSPYNSFSKSNQNQVFSCSEQLRVSILLEKINEFHSSEINVHSSIISNFEIKMVSFHRAQLCSIIPRGEEGFQEHASLHLLSECWGQISLNRMELAKMYV